MRILPLMLSLSLLALSGCVPPTTSPDTNGEPAAPRLAMYVMNGLGKTIDQVDLETLKVTPSVMTTGLYPNQLLTLGKLTYLVNSGDHNLIKLDLRARKTLDTFNLPNGSNPMTLEVIEGDKALVVNYESADVAFVNLASKAVEATLDLPKGQPGGGVAIASGKAYVAAVDATYGGPEVDYAPTYTFSGVYVIDLATRTLAKTIAFDAADANPLNVSVSPEGKIFVGIKDGLAVIDPATDTVIESISFGTQVGSVQYVNATKAYGSVYSGLVSFNPSTRQVLRGTEQAIAVEGAGSFKIFRNAAYVTNFAKDTVTVVDLATEAASGSPIPVGDGPQDITFVTAED